MGASSGETYHLKYTCANKQFYIYWNSPTHLLLLFVISYSYRRFLICVFMNITFFRAIFDVQHFRWAITINRWLLLNAVQNGIIAYYFIATLTEFGRKLHQFKWWLKIPRKDETSRNIFFNFAFPGRFSCGFSHKTQIKNLLK